MKTKDCLLELSHLDFSYYGKGKKVLHSISQSFDKGKLYCIVGPNGSGKSTLLKIIARQIYNKLPANGIFINGKDILSYSSRDRAKLISIMNQNNLFHFEFIVEDLVNLGRIPYMPRFSTLTTADKAIVAAAMEKTGVTHLAKKSVTEISGGELERVVFARTLAQDTAILLLDEPVSQMDVEYQLSIMDMVKKVVETDEKTVLMVLHDLNLAASYADNIIMMKEGAIIASGEPENVLTTAHIEEVYHLTPDIIQNPHTKKPFILHFEKMKNE